MTQDIIQELLSNSKEVFLPKVIGNKIDFRRITDFSSLEKAVLTSWNPRKTVNQITH